MKMLCLLIGLLLAFAALAQGEVIAPPTGDELVTFLQSLGGLKGAGSIAIIVIAVQGLLLFFRSSFAKFSGAFQILIVNGLTLIAGVIALKAQGMELSVALLHSQTIAAFQVFAHQVLKQVSKAKA
jgi:enamine deaminase RidA (YjgF/YER057c/UK114 family)